MACGMVVMIAAAAEENTLRSMHVRLSGVMNGVVVGATRGVVVVPEVASASKKRGGLKKKDLEGMAERRKMRDAKNKAERKITDALKPS